MDFFFDARTKRSLRSQRAQGQERSAETVSECYFNYYLLLLSACAILLCCCSKYSYAVAKWQFSITQTLDFGFPTATADMDRMDSGQ
jgi:hypothetical protein